MALLVNQVKITGIYDETSRLSENKNGVLFQYCIDEKKRAAASAEIPEGERDDAFALPFARNPLDKKSPKKETLADKPHDKQIIVKAIAYCVAKSE